MVFWPKTSKNISFFNREYYTYFSYISKKTLLTVCYCCLIGAMEGFMKHDWLASISVSFSKVPESNLLDNQSKNDGLILQDCN